MDVFGYGVFAARGTGSLSLWESAASLRPEDV